MFRSGVWLNIGCGPFRAPDPWINTDVVRVEGVIEPDLLVGSPWPSALKPHLGEENVSRLYMGHVLEHIRWDRIPDFLRELGELLTPGAEIMVVGPDSYRAIQMLVEGEDTIDDVRAILEDDLHFQDADVVWDGARHCWNCYEERLVRLLNDSGFIDVRAHPIDEDELSDWPVVSFTAHQCAVSARVPGRQLPYPPSGL